MMVPTSALATVRPSPRREMLRAGERRRGAGDDGGIETEQQAAERGDNGAADEGCGERHLPQAHFHGLDLEGRDGDGDFDRLPARDCALTLHEVCGFGARGWLGRSQMNVAASPSPLVEANHQRVVVLALLYGADDNVVLAYFEERTSVGQAAGMIGCGRWRAAGSSIRSRGARTAPPSRRRRADRAST